MKRRSAVGLFVASLLGALLLGGGFGRGEREPPTPPTVDDAVFWEAAIERFERRDAERPPRPGSVLFVGSSSVRLWPDLARDMEPLAVINRGFGGSQIQHTTHFVDRIVTPYAPRGIVLYAGDNDLTRHLERKPARVLADVRAFVDAIDAAELTTPVYFVSIKPSPARAAHWPRMAEANRLISSFADAHPRLTYVDVATPMLGADGKPRSDLFIEDGVHMNARGYAIWTKVLQPILLRDLGADAS